MGRSVAKEDLSVSICFVAHQTYGALAGGESGSIGGVERQTGLMARWLAARGFRVSMLTWDEGQQNREVIGGVRVIKICQQSAGVRGVRFFHPRWTGLISALRRADADVCYQNCGEYVTGQVALWCRRNGRRFVYSVANDADCDPALPEMHALRERVLYRCGLRRADRVIVQTHRQQVMLREGFGREAEVIPMPCVGPMNGEYTPPVLGGDGERRVLWIGRVCEQKRPDRLVELARLCPDVAFDLVGPIGQNEYVRGVVEQAQRVGNIRVHGPVAFDQVSNFYRKATCVVCTSAFEGFPNTFLEAWSHGLPVVTTFDPDGLVVGRGLGAVAEDVPALAAALRQLFGRPELWRRASGNARRYYLENHAAERVMPKFERVFLEVAGRASAGEEKR